MVIPDTKLDLPVLSFQMVNDLRGMHKLSKCFQEKYTKKKNKEIQVTFHTVAPTKHWQTN